MDSEIIRSIVGRREAQFILNNYGEDNARRIASVLFTTPWQSSVSTYLVRDPEIKSVAILTQRLVALNIDSDQLVGDIKALLILDDDLTPPPYLVKAFLTGEKVAVFTGAGVSNLLGISRWSELAKSAIDFLHSELSFSDQECEFLKREFLSPKDILSVFHKFVSKESGKFKEFYRKELVRNTSNFDMSNNPYYHLSRLNCVKITSNIEDEFGKALQRYKTYPISTETGQQSDTISAAPLNPEICRVCIREKDWMEEFDLNTDAIYHLHGVLDRPESLIMTSEDYVNAYYTQGSVFNFLKKLFAEYTVIFIGYGLHEYDVLERVMSKTNKMHYALIPINSTHMSEFEFYRKYFESFNVHPEPFFLDQSGHKRLALVLKHWADYIEQQCSPEFLEKRMILEEAL